MDEEKVLGAGQQPPRPGKRPSDHLTMGTLIAFGAMFGMVIGTAIHNLMWGLIIGAALGAVVGAIYEAQRAKP
jgi:uncharacterized membrane protein